MFLSRHQLAAALRVLDEARRDPALRCHEPRSVAGRERWADDGTIELRPRGQDRKADEALEGAIHVNEEGQADEHGAAFLEVDIETSAVRCAACARPGRGR